MLREQVRGGPVDPRSDVFGFGALLYEMLWGAPAFRRETGVETLHAILKETAPRLRECGLGPAAHAVQALLDACLAKEPDDRYPDVESLLVDLRAARQRLTAGEATAAASSGSTAAPAAPVAAARTGPLRVLIVDD